MIKTIQFLIFCLLGFLSTSQETEQQINEVNAVYRKLLLTDSIHLSYKLGLKDIEVLQPEDLGELLKKLPGTNLKSYGGLGGLKTISVRGLGSQHTQVVIDGFGQSNTQTGQLNFGQLNLENVTTLLLQPGQSSNISLPVSAQLSGNTIVIQSFQSALPTKKINLRFASRIGSFGQIDESLLIKIGNQKFYGGGFFKFRKATGDYPYQTTNYQTNVSGKRKNNDYQDLNAGLDLHFKLKNHHFNFYYIHFQAIQGLPGAVVLYNDFAAQRLFTQTGQYKLDYTTNLKKNQIRLYSNLSLDSISYKDPYYFGIDSVFISSFTTRTANFGAVAEIPLKKRIKISIGSEQLLSDLHSLQSLQASPTRSQNFSFLKATFSKNNWIYIAQVGSQVIQEKNSSGNAAKDIFRLSPYFEVGKTINKRYSFTAFYRNSLRLPSFNELYYNNIGNTALKPEDAHQFSLNNSLIFLKQRKIEIGMQIAVYYQRVTNMIQAIPTKNLFVWSIQNIGKNEIIGSDATLTLNYQCTKNWRTELISNYTFQNSIDISNKQSPTYKHQMAYVPLHSGNLDVSVLYKKHGIRFSTFYSSMRYSLNENITANEVNSFALLDISVFGNFSWSDHSKLRLQFTLKNVMNSSYSYVRSFIMPGRNYLITLTYEIH